VVDNNKSRFLALLCSLALLIQAVPAAASAYAPSCPAASKPSTSGRSCCPHGGRSCCHPMKVSGLKALLNAKVGSKCPCHMDAGRTVPTTTAALFVGTAASAVVLPDEQHYFALITIHLKPDIAASDSGPPHWTSYLLDFSRAPPVA
jgi:hypothetical protein